MPRFEVGIDISYFAKVIIEAEDLEDANDKVDEMATTELWDLSIDQGDTPDNNDVEVSFVQAAR